MSKIVGYARVSTQEQNLDRQIKALEQYVDHDMIVVDKASGKDLDRPGYQSLKYGIGKLQRGDILYVKSLDRLSRSKEDAKQELQYYKDNGIIVRIIDMPTTMMTYPEEQAWIGEMITNVLIEVLASIAQVERETIKKRQIEGLEAMPLDEEGKRYSKKTGKRIGRPTVSYLREWEEIFQKWKNGEITATKAMKLLQLKKNTFYKLVKSYSDTR